MLSYIKPSFCATDMPAFSNHFSFQNEPASSRFSSALIMSAVYSFTLPDPWTDQYATRRDGWPERLIGPFDWLGFGPVCGFPDGSYERAATPGFGFTVIGGIPIIDIGDLILGATYQTFGTPGFDDDEFDNSISSVDLKIGVEPRPATTFSR